MMTRKKMLAWVTILAVCLPLIALPSLANTEPAITHYWNFDDSPEDRSQNCCSLANPNSNVILVDGKVGKAVDVRCSELLITEAVSEQYSNAFSIAAWINCTSADQEFQTVFSKGPKTAGHFELYLQQRELKLYAPDLNGGNPCDGGAHIMVEQNEWVHVAVTYDGTKVTLYKNGTVAGETETAGSLAVPAEANKDCFGIGVLLDTSNPFQGYLDELLVSNTVLSADQVQRLAQSPEEAAEEWLTLVTEAQPTDTGSASPTPTSPSAGGPSNPESGDVSCLLPIMGCFFFAGSCFLCFWRSGGMVERRYGKRESE